MKSSAIVTFLALTIAAASAVEILSEHHQRFLQAKDDLTQELAAWKASAAGQTALLNGYYTEATFSTESTDADQDQLKRFFLTKLSIAESEKANPEATFSTNSPFTLMTNEEFAAYVKKSAKGTTTRQAFTVAANTSSYEEDYSLTAASSSVDWTTSGCVSPVKDQGNCGDCWAFSAVGSLESAYCLKKGSMTLFSDQQVTSCDTVSAGCDGGDEGDALQYVQKLGSICTQSSYPFKSGTTGTTGTCKPNSCTKVSVTISSVVTLPNSESGLISGITKQPVAVAVAAGNNEFKQYSGGVLSSCSTTDLDHAVLAVGYTSSYVYIKNQWGTSWGNNGFINLKRNGAKSACGVVNDDNVYPKLS